MTSDKLTPETALKRDIGETNEELKAAGLRVTAPRISVLRILETADPHHVSAEDIYRVLSDAGIDIAQATVYRILTQFESAGLVLRHQFDGGQARYELDVGNEHSHLICTESKAMTDFSDPLIDARLNEIAEANGYTLAHQQVVLYGKPLKRKPN